MLSLRVRQDRGCAVTAVVMCCLLGIASAPCRADDAQKDKEPAGPRCIECVPVEQPPTIDGALDDSCWRQAAQVEGFYRYDKDLPASEPTEAYICYDDSAIYVAFRCHDSKPGEIRCEQRKRGGSMWMDDAVSVRFDTYHEHRDGYFFEMNARGTQRESMLDTMVPKIEWRGDWRGAARIDAEGWTAEMAIPFSILRYPNGRDTWGVMFGRRIAREQEAVTWPRAGESWNWEKAADLTGLQVPPYRESTVLLPYALAESGTDTEDHLDFGFDIKRRLRSGLSLYGTYNPDFRDIEEVVDTIDFTYTERFLPDRRPFFADTWIGPRAVFYTNRIEEMRGGLAVTGRVGRHAPTVLLMNTRHQGNALALSYDYSLGVASELSLAFAGQQGAPTPDNQAGMVSVMLGHNTKVGSDSFEARYYRSHVEGEDAYGRMRLLSVMSSRGDGRVSFSAAMTEVSPDYDPELGYVPETGVRQFTGSLNWWHRHEKGRVRETWCWAWGERTNSLIGDLPYYSVSTGGGVDLTNHTWQSVSAYTGRREGYRDAGVSLYYGWNSEDLYRSGSTGVELGERLGGSSLYASLRQGVKLGENLALEARAEYLRMKSPVEPEQTHQFIVTAAYDLSNERTISSRMVQQPGAFNIYFTYRQAVRHGMDAYVIVGDPNADRFERRIAVKTVWAMFP